VVEGQSPAGQAPWNALERLYAARSSQLAPAEVCAEGKVPDSLLQGPYPKLLSLINQFTKNSAKTLPFAR
jgi:hypothetical protein